MNFIFIIIDLRSAIHKYVVIFIYGSCILPQRTKTHLVVACNFLTLATEYSCIMIIFINIIFLLNIMGKHVRKGQLRRDCEMPSRD